MSFKQQIIDNMKLLYQRKQITLRDGNISFKPRNQDYFYITAGSVLKDRLTHEQIVKVDFDDKTTKYDTNSLYRPSQELNMHYYLQKKRQHYMQDTYVVHAHPPNVIAYMGMYSKQVQLDSITTMFPEMNIGLIGKNVPFFDAGSEELAKGCRDNLCSPYTMVGLKQHGIMCVGKDIDEIMEHLETLEFYLDIYFKSTSLHIR